MTDPAQRASDAERERVAERLRTAAADGRLDHEELEERLAAAYASRTTGELETLGADLPAVVAPAPKPALIDDDLRRRLAGFASVNAICLAVWAATGAGSFWPVWVLLGTGIGLFSRGRGCGWHPGHLGHRRPRS